jgi:hypothetical protein
VRTISLTGCSCICILTNQTYPIDGCAPPESETQVQEPGPRFTKSTNYGPLLDILQPPSVVDDPRMFVDVLQKDGRKWFPIKSEM